MNVGGGDGSRRNVCVFVDGGNVGAVLAGRGALLICSGGTWLFLHKDPFLKPLNVVTLESEVTVMEIVLAEPSSRRDQFESRFDALDFMLKRSYLFGLERNFPSERLVVVLAMASSWRWESFWNRRPSPLGSFHRKKRISSYNQKRLPPFPSSLTYIYSPFPKT